MKGIVEERCVELGSYIVENQATVRAAAKQFGISKSTVHMDVILVSNQTKQNRVKKWGFG